MSSTSDDYDVIRYQLPKVELHAHLNGCIPLDLLHTLASERGVSLSSKHFDKATAEGTDDGAPDMYNVRPRSLQDCFDMFAELPRVINDLVALERITEAALQEFANHHTVYLELRSTPKRLRHDFRQETICSKREYVETIIQVMQRFERSEQERFQHESREENPPERAYLPLTCRLLLSVDRSQSIEEASETIALAIDMRKASEYVVGVDLGGNPTRRDFRDFLPLFQKARNAGCKSTIHCGEIECDDPASAAYAEAKAILEFQPDRIGHGVLLPQDLLDALEQRRIPVETCPTSNVMTLELHHYHHHTSESSKEHHGNLVCGLQRHTGLTHWFQTRHPMAICTDDPGVFDTNPTQELWLLLNAFSFLSLADLCSIVLQSLDFAFCSEAVMEHIRRQIQGRMHMILRA
jgi:adenosine deaminase